MNPTTTETRQSREPDRSPAETDRREQENPAAATNNGKSEKRPAVRDETLPPPPGRASRRWVVLAVVILLATGAGGYLWYAFERTAAYETRLVLQGDIDVRQVNLAFKVDGRIAELKVDEGDSVRAGQVVGTLDKVYFHDDLRRPAPGGTTPSPTWSACRTAPGRRRSRRPERNWRSKRQT
jgi:HlyD family secretion protein